MTTRALVRIVRHTCFVGEQLVESVYAPLQTTTIKKKNETQFGFVRKFEVLVYKNENWF